MNAATFSRLIVLTFVGVLALLLAPTLLYLAIGWTIRRDKLLSYLNDRALKIYCDQFPWSGLDASKPLSAQFRKKFAHLYGRRHYVAPLALFVFLSALATWALAHSLQQWSGVCSGPYSLHKSEFLALAGGLVWVVSDQLSRIVRRDLSPGDVYGWSFRVLLAIPFGFAVSAMVKDDVGLPLAFFLGAFPTTTLFMIARRIAVAQLKQGDDKAGGVLELEKLQSVSRGTAEALQDEGIDTITALAWADPVDLTIRTNLDFNYVLDCMSQALLWVYFEDQTRKLFPLSLRGAQEVRGLVNDLKDVCIPREETAKLTDRQKQAVATLEAMAACLNIDDAALLTTLQQVAYDPYTDFIYQVWH